MNDAEIHIWPWVQMLLAAEAVVLVTVLALALPCAIALLVRDLWKTYRRNR
jgi:hypothetical protein